MNITFPALIAFFLIFLIKIYFTESNPAI